MIQFEFKVQLSFFLFYRGKKFEDYGIKFSIIIYNLVMHKLFNGILFHMKIVKLILQYINYITFHGRNSSVNKFIALFIL